MPVYMDNKLHRILADCVRKIQFTSYKFALWFPVSELSICSTFYNGVTHNLVPGVTRVFQLVPAAVGSGGWVLLSMLHVTWVRAVVL